MIIGITGGMGCGKSTAGRLFEERGFLRIDSDEVVRRELLADPAVEGAIRTRLGAEMLTAEGRVNRGALAKVVFAHPAELAWLEDQLHPRLYAYWRERLTAQPQANWVIEVPLLFEKALENWFDFTVCVATSLPNQLARLAERGLPQALAEQRISKQLPLAQKIERAHFVLSNDGSLPFLRDQVAQLIDQLDVRA
jgi:dephospho-CoA kinase